MDISQLIFYGVLLLLGALWVRNRVLSASIPQVSRGDAEEKARTGKAILVDVRTVAERRRTSLDRSVHIPMSELTDLVSRLEMHREKEIIFYCATGSRSVSAAMRAKKLGFTVSNLQGGIGW